jgi:uncharacterized membrane protein YjgN (DUF898 family)
MAYGKFDFKGTGLSYLWLFIWTAFLTVITFGLYTPWAASAALRWGCANTYIDGKRLCFKGSGAGYFANWLLIIVLTIITLGIYAPWGAVRFYRWITNNTYFADQGDIEYLVDTKGIEKNDQCKKCSARLPEGATFCGECGNKLD